MRHLFNDIIMPCIPVLHRLEMRGIPLDKEKRDEFRKEARGRLNKAAARLGIIAADFHAKRVNRVTGAIEGLQASIRTLVASPPIEPCAKHPTFGGFTRRLKCDGCAKVYQAAAPARGAKAELQTRVTKGKQKAKSISEAFKPTSDDHWREWLFDPDIGLALSPVSRTEKRRDPQVDDDAIEKLQRRYPDVEALTLRVDVQSTKYRLATRLAVEPDPDGRVRFAYAMSRTNNGRISSGKDDEEVDKFRDSPGNSQNIPERDRAIYRAEPGQIFVTVDWSQIEARVCAWLAGEEGMLQAWREGLDIHAINGQALAEALGVTCAAPEDSKCLTLRFSGEVRSYRYAAKRMTHGWNYGMHAKKTGEIFGIPKETAECMRDAYFERWPALAAYHTKVVELASRAHRLRNPFGRVFPFWQMKKTPLGVWEIADKEEALAFNPASSVGDMIKAVAPAMEACAKAHDGELLQTMHDSFLSQLPDNPTRIAGYMSQAQAIMEQTWPELGLRTGEEFACPADFSKGMNWGKAGKDNPDGQKEIA